MVVGVVSAVVQACLTGPATRKLGEGDGDQAVADRQRAGLRIDAGRAQNVLVLVLTVGFFVFCERHAAPVDYVADLQAVAGRAGHGPGAEQRLPEPGPGGRAAVGRTLFDFSLTLPYMSAAVIMLVAFIYAVKSMSPERMAMAGQLTPAPVYVVDAGED